MISEWRGLLWLLILLGPLLFAQRSLHRELQAVLLLVTRRVDITMMLFSVVFFPGILLHESSHYLVARILGVRTGGFSLLPKPLPNGKLRLGYVETEATDWLRDALKSICPKGFSQVSVVEGAQPSLSARIRRPDGRIALI